MSDWNSENDRMVDKVCSLDRELKAAQLSGRARHVQDALYRLLIEAIRKHKEFTAGAPTVRES